MKANRITTIISFLVLVFSSLSSMSFAAEQNQITLKAVGNETRAVVGRILNDDGAYTTKRATLKFDLSALPDNVTAISSATLYLTGNESGKSSETFDIKVMKNEILAGLLSSDKWQDDTLNAIPLDISKLDIDESNEEITRV